MIKMMVVEDEVILREGICCVGNWESLEVEICGTAGNGKEALQQMMKCKPDIILTDVVMPVMDGIELARWVHEQYPEIRVIMLSGHEEFAYVKKAMDYKACHYLLKPAKIEKIEETVAEVRDEILREESRRQEEERLKIKLADSIPILREHYLNQLVNGIELNEGKIKAQFAELNIGLETGNIAVLICEPDRKEQGQTDSKIALLQLTEICQEVMCEEYRCVVFTDIRDRVVTVLNYPDDMYKKDVVLYLEGKAVRIQNEMEARANISVSMGIGRLKNSIRYLSKAYKEVDDALAYRFFMGNKSVIYIGDIEREEHGDWLLLEQAKEEVLVCIKAGDVTGLEEQINRYFLLLGQHSAWEQSHVYEEVAILVNYLFRFIRGMQTEAQNGSLPELDKLAEDLRKKNTFATLAELQMQVSFVVRSIANQINKDRVLRNEGIIDRARKYVQKNVSGDVSLITVADSVYVSPNYLSFLFKESGENFKDYVIRTKMQKAKEMTESGKYSMNQIALELGYKDGRYLSQIYKKYQDKLQW